MATRKTALQIAIEGDNEYKKAIADINKSTKVLNSEMQLLEEKYKGTEDSMEALTDRSDVLERRLLSQKEKITTVKEALANSTKAFGEAHSRTKDWHIQLNNAEREQIKLERALEETNQKLQTQKEASEKAAEEIETLADASEDAGEELATLGEELSENDEKIVTLGDQVSDLAERFGVKLPESVKGALDHVNGFSTGTVAAMGAAAASVAAVKLVIDGVKLGIEAVQKLHQMTLEQAAWADELLTRSSQTGLDTELLQALDYAEKFLDFEGLDESLVKLTQSMGQAASGAKTQSEAFEQLGVSVKNSDGSMRDNWEVMMETIDALGEIENETERDILSNAIFGESYSKLKPLIDAGSDSLQGMIDTAKESGQVLSEDQVKVLGEVDDAYQQMQAEIDATKKQLSVEFAPISKTVMEDFGTFVKNAGQAVVDSGILTSLQGFIEPLGSILDSLGQLINTVLPMLTPLVEGAAAAFGWLAEKVAAVVNWVANLKAENIQQTMEDVGDMGYWGDYNPAFAGANAPGDINWRGGLTWVGESGPELVSLPRGTQIYSSQESGLIAANGGTDTSRMEELLARSVVLQEQIAREFGALRVKRRMA